MDLGLRADDLLAGRQPRLALVLVIAQRARKVQLAVDAPRLTAGWCSGKSHLGGGCADRVAKAPNGRGSASRAKMKAAPRHLVDCSEE